jgi:putative transposase
VNKKRIHRLYIEENLQLRTRRKKKRRAVIRVPLATPVRPNERWSMDFMSDTLAGGKRYRVSTLVDVYSRECLVLDANFSMKAQDVVQALMRLRDQGRVSNAITVDNGSEFSSKDLDTWAYVHGVKLDFIRPGKPVENAFIESFNGKVRDECLDANLFFSLAEARAEIARWKTDYNTVRPHSSLGGIPPSELCRREKLGAQDTHFSRFERA